MKESPVSNRSFSPKEKTIINLIIKKGKATHTQIRKEIKKINGKEISPRTSSSILCNLVQNEVLRKNEPVTKMNLVFYNLTDEFKKQNSKLFS